jgi:nitrate reductase gamma subunit
MSSQFLENKSHFWALVPFHYGIIFVLLGHIVALLIPKTVLLWNSMPLRLYAIEITGLALGVMALVGAVAAIARRATTPHLRVVTSRLDWLLWALLVSQIASGVGVAVMHPWGSSWFAAAMSPYLWSLITLNPESGYVTALPFMIKWHVLNAWLLLLVWPFSRLAHVLVAPNPYLWRRPQVVRWNSVSETRTR